MQNYIFFFEIPSMWDKNRVKKEKSQVPKIIVPRSRHKGKICIF